VSVLAWARTLWDYHHLDHALRPADCIIVLGSHDTRVAERGAEVFLAGFSPLVVCSGNLGSLTREKWNRPEAEIFAEVAVEKGVPRERILIYPEREFQVPQEVPTEVMEAYRALIENGYTGRLIRD